MKEGETVSETEKLMVQRGERRMSGVVSWGSKTGGAPGLVRG